MEYYELWLWTQGYWFLVLDTDVQMACYEWREWAAAEGVHAKCVVKTLL